VTAKYVSLAAIVRIPGFYYSSLVGGDHKLLRINKMPLEIKHYRKHNLVSKAGIRIKIMRFI